QRLGLSNPRFYEALWNDYHPPGYLLLMSAWCTLFGESEFALRAPSALSGVLLVGAVFGFCRRAFDLNTAAVCALLTAVSPFFLHYSQEARGFMPTALACTLAATRVLRLCTVPVARLGWRSTFASAALLAACGYLQYTG